MNVAINFYSDDYRKYVEELVEEVYADTEAAYNGVRLLQEIARDMYTRFYDYIVPNSITREDLLNDEDATLVLMTKLLIRLEKNYPNAHVIGFFPVNLKGQILAVLHMEHGTGLNINSITELN